MPGLESADRVVLATAALHLFRTRAAMRKPASETEQILDRLPDRGDTAAAWKRQFGMSEDEFTTRVALITSGWREIEHAEYRADVPVRRPARLLDVAEASTAPSWLRFQTGGPASHMVASRNWGDLEGASDAAVDLEAVWGTFEAGDYPTTQALLWPLFASVGESWSPVLTPDGARAWNFLRLVWLLGQERLAGLRNRRRSLVSATEAATRSVPDAMDLVNWLVDQSLRDYVAADPGMEADWAVHSARLVASAGPSALDVYTSDQKVELRRAWESRFGEIVDGMRQTYQMVDALTSEFRFRHQELARAAEPDGLVQRRITAPLRRIAPFLDADEARISATCTALIPDVIVYLAKEEPSASDGASLIARCDIIAKELAGSESLLLQDVLGPAVSAMRDTCKLRDDEHKSGSRPVVVGSLVQNRFPLSSQVNAPFPIQIALRNDGNAPAELVELMLESLAVEIAQPQQIVERIAPGAEHTVEFKAVSVADASIAQLTLELAWRDHLDQTFTTRVELRAEDQRQSSWHADDANPFKLGTIANPSRLVGRGEDLDALERTMAGGGSAAVTGLKRVGKSSLAKTLLTRMSADGWATAYLPLGQVLSGSPSAAQLASALIETVYDSVVSADPDVLLPEPPAVLEENFARVAGRWIRQASSVLLRADKHVLIAIDDFDELPGVLYEGVEADALFLFLRSVIDEPWLSIMFIGSEILPSIIDAQAHKLNQVSPLVVSNFKSVKATRQLLEEPTKASLDWQESAFNRAHFLTGGNPYYLTLLGQEIWQTLRDLDRTFVAVGDVDDALAQIAQSGSLTHFVHLWADSLTGLDGRSRSALIASAVLRAVAQVSGSDFQFVNGRDAHEVALNWLPSLTDAEFTAALASLVARSVLVARDDAHRLAIPLSSAWLIQEGARELDKQFSAARVERSRVRRFAHLDLMRLTRNVSFCGEAISEVRLSGWLEQFSEDDRYFAFLLAKRLFEEGFFSNTKLTQEILPSLKRAISSTSAWSTRVVDGGGYAKNVYFLVHGAAGSSSHGITGTLAKLLKVKKTNIVDAADFMKATKGLTTECVLIVADDFAGSGNQLREVLSQTLAGFADVTGPWRENLRVVIAAGLAANLLDTPGSEVAVESAVGHMISSRLFAFDGEADIFESQEEIDAAATLIDAVGNSLSPGRPRGFGEMGLLVVTEHNCPNNTLPIFWKAGQHAGSDWLPLFERRL